MPEEKARAPSTLALNTKLEEDFVSPLTALRGSLEILRDHPDLAEQDRRRFIDAALHGCARLETSIQELAQSVYAAGKQSDVQESPPQTPDSESSLDARIHFHDAMNVVEIDFSDFEFSSSNIVGDFYDAIEALVTATGHKWYFLVNYRNCSVWPEAWVAFAHRGKKVNVLHSLGTVRYKEEADSGDNTAEPAQADMFSSREAALQHIEAMQKSDPVANKKGF